MLRLNLISLSYLSIYPFLSYHGYRRKNGQNRFREPQNVQIRRKLEVEKLLYFPYWLQEYIYKKLPAVAAAAVVPASEISMKVF